MGVLSRPAGLIATALSLALLIAPRISAQRAAGAELGAFAALTSFSPRFDLRVGVGGGVRVGYFLSPGWSVELDGSAQRAGVEGGGRTIPLTVVDVQVLHNFGRDRPAWYVVGGYARLHYAGSPPGHFGDHAAMLGIGHRLFVWPRLAVRGDLRGLYSFSSGLAGRGAGHILATAGVSYFTITGAPPDRDGDRVPDDRDACPRTPSGAAVDLQGCPVDSDADGTLDGLDRCPNTPYGSLVDRLGCPVDEDRDGVYDGIDQCPGTLAGTAVDARGCPLDADGDGVADVRDRCPATPPGTPVDPAGCPPARDMDGDGVYDANDRCPGTPAGIPVDALGCWMLFPPGSDTLVLQRVTFESGRARLLPSAAVVLDEVAASLVAHPEVRIEIAGYTDSSGSAAQNNRLAAARAEAVRSSLIRRGVSADRMVARGYGPANPVASNATSEGRARNRRVELHRL